LTRSRYIMDINHIMMWNSWILQSENYRIMKNINHIHVWIDMESISPNWNIILCIKRLWINGLFCHFWGCVMNWLRVLKVITAPDTDILHVWYVVANSGAWHLPAYRTISFVLFYTWDTSVFNIMCIFIAWHVNRN
jgi:hypothetical protein